MSTYKVIEVVPARFVRRAGDWVQEGSNNQLIIMGTDRAAPGPASVDDGLGTVEAKGQGTGVIHLVVGRGQIDPDFTSDDSFVYIARRTNADDNLQCAGIVQGTKNQPAIVAKSTDVRIAFGGPSAAGCLKVYFDDSDKDKYVYVDQSQLQLSMAPDSTLTMDKDTITAQVNGNSIQIARDGTVSISSSSQVNVQTQSCTISADTCEITGDTTIDGQLLVKQAVTMNTTLAVVQQVNTPIVGTGQITTPTGVPVPSTPGDSTLPGSLTVNGPAGITTAGPVKATEFTSDTGVTLDTHVHVDSRGGTTTRGRG
jgi:hypothetical protein